MFSIFCNICLPMVVILGFVPAIQNLGSHVEHRLCVKHLYANFKKRYPGLDLKEVFWMAARATTVPAWERAMN